MVCCPMSTQIKGHPFEVVTEVDGVASAVLSDQVKSLDWKVRHAKKKGFRAERGDGSGARENQGFVGHSVTGCALRSCLFH